MTGQGEVVFYMCPQCLSIHETEGFCERCKVDRLGCRPGEPDNPCRKPLQDSAGRFRTRAPIWWVEMTMDLPFDPKEND